MNKFSSKKPNEIQILGFDFGSQLESGEVIVWQDISCDAFEGDDSESKSMIVGSAWIEKGKVKTKIGQGIDGNTYKLRCTVQTSLGRTAILDGFIEVEDFKGICAEPMEKKSQIIEQSDTEAAADISISQLDSKVLDIIGDGPVLDQPVEDEDKVLDIIGDGPVLDQPIADDEETKRTSFTLITVAANDIEDFAKAVSKDAPSLISRFDWFVSLRNKLIQSTSFLGDAISSIQEIIGSTKEADNDCSPEEIITKSLSESKDKTKMSPTDLYTKTFSFEQTEIKQVTKDGINYGVFTGYASTFGNVDRKGDMVARGAFLNTIADFQAKGRPVRMYFQHDSMELIGGFDSLSLREDEKGLYVVGYINLEVQRGREAYALAKQGILTDMSIGFNINDFKLVDGVRVLTDITLWEISMVCEPANPQATIISVKSIKDQISTKRDVEKVLRDAGLSRSSASFIASLVDEKKIKSKENITEQGEPDSKLIDLFTILKDLKTLVDKI